MNWAKRHLEALDADLRAFHKSEPCRISTKDDFEKQKHILSVGLKDVPEIIPLRCGDAFYCMRASLEQLVWRLAKLNVTIPDIRVQFPIIESWDNNTRGRFRLQTLNVPADAVALIRDLQPANRTAPVELSHLWRLNAMCNLDKHRRIPANGSQFEFKIVGVDPRVVTIEMFDDHGEFSVPLADKEKVHFHPNPTFQVVFGDISSKVVLGPDEMREIYEFLSDSVLPRFARFFT